MLTEIHMDNLRGLMEQAKSLINIHIGMKVSLIITEEKGTVQITA